MLSGQPPRKLPGQSFQPISHPNQKHDSKPSSSKLLGAAASSAFLGAQTVHDVSSIDRKEGLTQKGQSTFERALIQNWFPEGVTLDTDPNKISAFIENAMKLFESMGDIRTQETLRSELKLDDHVKQKGSEIYFRNIDGTENSENKLGNVPINYYDSKGASPYPFNSIFKSGTSQYSDTKSVDTRNNLFKMVRTVALRAISTVLSQFHETSRKEIASTNDLNIRIKSLNATITQLKKERSSTQAQARVFQPSGELQKANSELRALHAQRQKLLPKMHAFELLAENVRKLNEAIGSSDRKLSENHQSTSLKLGGLVQDYKSKYTEALQDREQLEKNKETHQKRLDSLAEFRLKLALKYPLTTAKTPQPPDKSLAEIQSDLVQKSKANKKGINVERASLDQLEGRINSGGITVPKNSETYTFSTLTPRISSTKPYTEEIREATHQNLTNSIFSKFETQFSDMEREHLQLQEKIKVFNSSVENQKNHFDTELERLKTDFQENQQSTLSNLEQHYLNFKKNLKEILPPQQMDIIENAFKADSINSNRQVQEIINSLLTSYEDDFDALEKMVNTFESLYTQKVYGQLSDTQTQIDNFNGSIKALNTKINRIKQEIEVLNKLSSRDKFNEATKRLKALVDKANVWIQAYNGIEHSEQSSVSRQSLDRVPSIPSIPKKVELDEISPIKLPSIVTTKPTTPQPADRVQNFTIPELSIPSLEFDLGLKPLDDQTYQFTCETYLAEAFQLSLNHPNCSVKIHRLIGLPNDQKFEEKACEIIEQKHSTNYARDHKGIIEDLKELSEKFNQLNVTIAGQKITPKLLQNSMGLGVEVVDRDANATYIRELSDPSSASIYINNLKVALNRMEALKSKQESAKKYATELFKSLKLCIENIYSVPKPHPEETMSSAKSVVKAFIQGLSKPYHTVIKRLSNYVDSSDARLSPSLLSPVTTHIPTPIGSFQTEAGNIGDIRDDVSSTTSANTPLRRSSTQPLDPNPKKPRSPL